MTKIEFSKEMREALAEALSRYLKAELDLEVKGFDAQFLLDFISQTLGPHYYNQGLWDAQAALQTRLDLISQAIDELEKPAKL